MNKIVAMDFNNIKDLEKNSFKGFDSISELWEDKSIIPKEKGVYLVLNPDYKNTECLKIGVGGFFKGKDPNVSLGELNNNFVEDSLIVYIGKAGSPTGSATLHSRLGQYLSFGKGKNVGHYGGRYIWQLKNHADLIICWKTTPNCDPRKIESSLIEDYKDNFNKLPFANLTS